MQIDGLLSYIGEFNKTHQTKLHIWSRNSNNSSSSSNHPPAASSNPTVVRFKIPDVLTAFINLGYTKSDPVLIVQTVTAFGPREKVGGPSLINKPSLIDISCRNPHIHNLIIPHTKTSHSKSQKWSVHTLACPFNVLWYVQIDRQQRVPFTNLLIDSA